MSPRSKAQSCLGSPNSIRRGCTKVSIMDSLAPARSALAGLRLRPMELPLLPSVSHDQDCRCRDLQTFRRLPGGSSALISLTRQGTRVGGRGCRIRSGAHGVTRPTLRQDSEVTKGSTIIYDNSTNLHSRNCDRMNGMIGRLAKIQSSNRSGAHPDGSGRLPCNGRDSTKVTIISLISTRKTFDRMNRMDRISRVRPELLTMFTLSAIVIRMRIQRPGSGAHGVTRPTLRQDSEVTKGSTIIYDNSTNLHSGNCDRMNRMDRILRGRPELLTLSVLTGIVHRRRLSKVQGPKLFECEDDVRHLFIGNGRNMRIVGDQFFKSYGQN